MLLLFEDLLVEHSKNDAIPELNRMKDHLAVILIGAPATGKTSFYNNFIRPKNHNIAHFSSDDVRRTLAKGDVSVNPDHPSINGKDSALLKQRMKHYMQSGQNFVYDFTGSNEAWIAHAVVWLRELGYTIIFIHLLAPLAQALAQNQKRERHTPEYFLQYAYRVTQKLMKVYQEMHPDKYYVVLNIDRKYKFFQYINGQLHKRKVDRYEPM